MALHPAEKIYVTRTETGLGVVRSCKLCKFSISRRKIAGAGRGAGMREGNKQRGVIIQHLKSAHPAEYENAMKEQP